MAQKRVTRADVARAAEVSVTTVSFVLNDTQGQSIPDATRERVLQAAEELGYRAHPLAKALREGSSRVVVLEVGTLPRAPMLESFIDGLDAELAALDHGLLVSYGSASRLAGRMAIDAVRPAAVIDLPGMYAREDAAADGGWTSGMASHFAVQIGYLREQGHRRIAIAVPAEADDFLAALAEKAVEAAERAGVDAVRVVVPGELDLGGATAVAAISDALALRLLAQLDDAGIRVPEEVAVIGLGDTAEAELWRPGLTSVRLDARAYGQRAARQALGRNAPNAPVPQSRVIRRETA